MTALIVDVVGLPAPQGSKRAFVVNGRAVMSESSKKVRPWRQDVVAATCNTMAEESWLRPAGPVEVTVCFLLPRPKAHYRTGQFAHLLRDRAPLLSSKKPDIDKLARATLDALTTSGAFGDDAQVARLVVEKRYADGPTGAHITISPLDGAPEPAAPAAAATASPAPRTAAPSTAGAAATPPPEGGLF